MKRVSRLAGLSLLLASSTMAGTLPKCGNDSGDWQGWNGVLCYLMVGGVTTIAIPLELYGTTHASSSRADNREEYVGYVREDAAEFVATDGNAPVDALLADVMKQVRANVPGAEQISDLEIAKLVEVDFN